MASVQPTSATTTPERVFFQFEELGLSPYEARVLVALLRLGAANTAQLSKTSTVPRTSTYQILEELSKKGVAQRLSVDGPAMWTCPSRDDVFDRLDANAEERLRTHRARTARLREEFDDMFPADSSAAGPYVQVLQGANQVSQLYDRLLARATREVLVFNRLPYSLGDDRVNPVVLDALLRGVKARVLYEQNQWSQPDSEAFRRAMDRYHEEGVEGRLVAELPLKLAVVDREAALLAMADPVQPDIGFPTTLLVEHPGFAALQADAFEQRWASAVPIPALPPVEHEMRRTIVPAPQHHYS